MNSRRIAISAFLLAASCGVAPVSAQQAAPFGGVRQSESAVRQMPIEQRPNRLGHFYGNNVRRRQTGKLFVNRGRTDRPMARYFYFAR